jgi:hypothetical protein
LPDWEVISELNDRENRPSRVDGAIGCIRRYLIPFVFFSTCFGSTMAFCGPDTADGEDGPAQTQTAQPGKAGIEKEQTHESGAKNPEKKGEWLLAPIPISSPAIGSGLEWAVARVFPFSKKDEVSPPSALGVGGIFTNNGSRGIAIGGRLYLKEDRYRVAAGVASASINFDVYGIGKDAANQGTFIPLNVNGGGGIGEFLFRVRKNIYLGLRGQYRNATLSLNQERLNSSDMTSQPPDEVANVIEQFEGQLTHQTTVSLGPRFQWDNRDSVFYPKRGFLMEVASQ